MSKQVHIFNGDSTKQIFLKSSIPGDIIVWREMLCEGPIHKKVGSDDFWKIRYDFFEKELGISKLEYFDNSIKEITKLENISSYKKVILWFEFDLFCQINLMALCSYLLRDYKKDTQYYLICTGKEKGTDYLHSLSDYSPDEYGNLFEKKKKISRHDLLFAEECWHKYVENNLGELKNFDFNKSRKFKYFQRAIHQHLKRFPGFNGLNQIENQLLLIISSGLLSEKEILKKILNWQIKETVYGFGDSQYVLYLQKLGNYYDIENNHYILNSKGKEVISNL